MIFVNKTGKNKKLKDGKKKSMAGIWPDIKREEKKYLSYAEKETACTDCGTFFDWSKLASIQIVRKVVWG